MKKCYKDASRKCCEECAAYSVEAKNDTHCLELASSIELSSRVADMIRANEINALYLKAFAKSMGSLEGTIRSAFKM